MPNSKLVLTMPRGVVWATLALAAFGCTQGNSGTALEETTAATTARPNIVVTNTVLCNLTEQIAGDTVALTCLLDYGQDPHVYKPSPSDRAAVDDADLIFYGGYEFEPAVIGLIQATANSSPQIAVFEEAVPNPLMTQGDSHNHGEEDPGHDDEHSHDHGAAEQSSEAALTPDPHVWQNAANNSAIVSVLVEHLNTAAPDNAELYTQRGNELQSQFAQLDAWIQAQVATVPASNRSLVTTHDAFRYFADAYGFEVGGVLSGLSTAETPSASTLTGLVKDIQATEVPAVFSEATTNPKLIETVARDAGVTVAAQPLYDAGPGGPNSEAETVQSMLVANTCNIVNALEGSCDVSSAPL